MSGNRPYFRFAEASLRYAMLRSAALRYATLRCAATPCKASLYITFQSPCNICPARTRRFAFVSGHPHETFCCASVRVARQLHLIVIHPLVKILSFHSPRNSFSPSRRIKLSRRDFYKFAFRSSEASSGSSTQKQLQSSLGHI